MTSATSHTGGCHCGAVRFEVDADLATAEILDCNCSICSKKGFLHLIVDARRFRLLTGEDELSTYQFGSAVAIHRFCKVCGIHAFYTPRSHPDRVDVNVRCIDDVRVEDLTTSGFDGRNWEENIDTIRG